MPQVPYHQSEKAGEPFRKFLAPLIAEAGAHENVVQMWATTFQVKPKTVGQAVWRLDGGKYPLPHTVERLAFALRGEHAWAWSPVLFYASGWLECLVRVVATVNLNKISAGRLLELLCALPDAVAGDPSARQVWILTGSEQTAFDTLEQAQGRTVKRALGADGLEVALALSSHFELRYDLLRESVLDSLISWAKQMAAEEAPVGIRIA